MKKMWGFAGVLFVATAAFGQNDLWVDGKEQPGERVNAGLKALSPDVFMKVAEKVDQAVVNISTTQVIKGAGRGFSFSPFGNPHGRQPGPQNPFGDDFFERFFGGPGPMPPEEQRQSSLGSGFILNPEGYVVTNNHVVERADEIKVILSDESEFKARVIGRDPKTDVALLKIEVQKRLRSVILGDSDQLKVGEVVVAIGNPFGLSHTVTQGIVSAKERSIGYGSYDDFIQTDASINPGNSGGPLLNLNGEVVGINAAIVASGQGIGFAIPINLAKSVLLKLKTDGKVVRGWLGVVIQKITPEHATALKLASADGALVSDVMKNSPAQRAGLKAGDVIVRFKDRPIKDWHELPMTVAGTSVGEKVAVEVVRDGRSQVFQVEVAKLDDSEEGAAAAEPAKADRLGLRVQDLTPEAAKSLGVEEDVKGVLVSDVDPQGVASSKGVRRGDVILEVNRKKASNRAAYAAVVSKLKKGDTVLLLMRRGRATQFIAFTL